MARQQRPTVARTGPELQEMLNDALDALVSACNRFDRGDTREYRQMSAIIRNLCRDTRMSHSLLGQLGLKTRRFLSCSPTIPDGNKLSECHLVELLIRPNLREKAAAWRAVLDGAPMAFWAFDEWWTTPVVVQPNGNKFSRSNMVGYVADQDGGVHVDPGIDAAFQEMRQEAFQYTNGRSTTEFVDRHAIRQIAHEMIKSLRPSYRRSHRVTGAYAVFRVPSFSDVGAPEAAQLTSYHLTPSGSECPCGSGQVFEECHRKGAVPPMQMQKTGGEFTAPPGAAFARLALGVRPT